MWVLNKTAANSQFNQTININKLLNTKAEIAYRLFYRTFDIVHAETPALKDEVHKLRYQVFCKENQGYEDPSLHPNEREYDAYDDHAEHSLLIYKPLNLPLGCVRVILPRKDQPQTSFPLQGLIAAPEFKNNHLTMNSCEISRLCISRERRELIKSSLLKSKHKLSLSDPTLMRMALSMAPIGLISGCFRMALKNDIENCYGVMEQHHLNKLISIGLKHYRLGNDIQYHGVRTPFKLNILETLDHTYNIKREVWSIVSDNGIVHDKARNMRTNTSAVVSIN